MSVDVIMEGKDEMRRSVREDEEVEKTKRK
jgi:hypothetical protein